MSTNCGIITSSFFMKCNDFSSFEFVWVMPLLNESFTSHVNDSEADSDSDFNNLMGTLYGPTDL